MRNEKGLTLTELMVTISILGLVLAVSAPAFGRFLQSWRLSGEVAEMATSLRAARNAAVTKGIDVIFVFDTNNSEYFYLEDSNSDGVASAGEYQSATHSMAAGIAIDTYTTPQPWVTFGSKGNTIDGGTIRVKNTREDLRSLRIFNGTGSISVE